MKWAGKLILVVILLYSSLLTSVFAQAGSSLTFSEVMFTPSESNGEFIEIYNTSTTDTVDLATYRFKYYTSALDILIAFQGGTKLAPGKYAVVIENDYDWNNGIYKTLIPAGTVVMKISDNSFGTSGMANTTSRDIYLYNTLNQQLDTYTYSADNSDGYSDEKITIDKNNNSANWSNTQQLNGTPGKKNSVTPADFDLATTITGINPTSPVTEDSVAVTVKVKNLGRLNAANFSVEIFNDINLDSQGQTNERIFTQNYSNLSSNDSLLITKKIYAEAAGAYGFVAQSNFAQDEKSSNNKAVLSYNVSERPASFNDIVINEIMYAPSTDEPEWIEIFNKSNRTYNLKNWKIGDNSSLTTISTGDLVINPNEYLIISDDATIINFYTVSSQWVARSLPSLSNGGDQIILKDNQNRKIDSLSYQPSWGGNTGGKSLERVSTQLSSTESSNWKSSTSIFKATPGRINSVTAKNKDLSVKQFVFVGGFAEVGRQIQLKAEIENLGFDNGYNFAVRFYKDDNNNSIGEQNELVSEELLQNINAGQIKEFILNTTNFAAGNNHFLVIVEYGEDQFPENNSAALNITGYVINELRGDLVINEIMYSPNSPEPEWIEVYNRSSRIINMLDYKIADDAATTRVINSSLVLNPGNYLVIAKDSSIVTLHNNIPLLRISTFASLNNSGDRVMLLDSLNRVIDSLDYKSSWGGSGGKSLERIDAIRSSVDSTNWKTSVAIKGSTPGYFNSATPYDNNLALSILSHSPLSPIKGDSVTVNIKIENIGKNTASNFSLEIFDDVNWDSVAQSTERISIKNYTSLASSAVIITQIKIYSAQVRGYRIIARLNFSADEVLSNNIAFREYSVSEIPASINEIIINEIMYAPSSDEPEWIEIYNRSNRTLNLKDWKIGDNTALTTISSTEYLFSPGEYLVISSDAAISNYYNITSRLLIRSLPSLSNSGDDVRLKDNINRTIDSVKYLPAWGGNNGKSLERKYADSLSTRQSNWGTSISANKATPGKFNSISPLRNNLSVSIPSILPAVPIVGDSVSVTIKIENIGKNRADNFSMEMFNDLNLDSTPQETEKISTKNISSLISFSSISFQVKVYAAEIRLYRILVKVNYSPDEDLSDNSVMKEYTVVEAPASSKEIVVNEIMYAPSNDEPEWVELINKSSRSLNLKNWKIGDNTSLVTISTSDYILNPGEYLIVSSDSTISNYYQISSKFIVKALPSLSNSGDDVILKSNLNTTIDSIKYFSAWGGTGNKSLERISFGVSSNDSVNWKTSRSRFRATPGRINSTTIKINDLSLKNFTSTSKYAEIGTSINVKAVVENLGSSLAASFTIKIFNDKNFDAIDQSEELISETNGTNLVAGASATFEFSVSNFISGINQFIAKVELTNDEYSENNYLLLNINGIVINERKGDLVINEFMYAPTSPEQEWIEIYNASIKQINLKGYKISNLKDTTKVINASIMLQPEEYFVITKDTTAFIKYPKIPKLIISGFPTLSNTRDKLMLLDSLNRTIDSLEYKSLWGGSGGKSLERIDAKLFSTDSTNWKTSTHTNGATPGFINSVSKKNFDYAVKRILFNPSTPIVNSNVSISCEVTNLGKLFVSTILILRKVNNDGTFTHLESKELFAVYPDSSRIYNFNYKIFGITSKQTFEVFVTGSFDEDRSNDKIKASISPSYSPQMVLLNEIMYTPLNGEPEWIELYNNSQYDIDLSDWSITDVLTTPVKTKIQAKDYIFPSKTFLVVAKDSTIINFHSTIPSKLIISSFANLNNDADGVVLKDSRDVTIDSVRYDSFWGGANGKSLEKKSIGASSVDKKNWSSSKDIELSTPGRDNSITQKRYDLTVNAITTTPQYPLLNEDVNFSAKVVNYGLEQAADFTVKFYLKTNNSATFLAEGNGINLNGGDSTWIVSNTKLKLNDNKTILCKVIFSSDEDTLNNSFIAEIRPGLKRNTVLVSELMYDPLTGESEWIEIYNASSDPVDLKNWSISDLLPSPTKSLITIKDNFLNPGEYAIITYDSLKYPYYPPRKFFQAKFGSLSTTDGVLIYDFRNAVIDSLKYNSAWGGAKGYSMERLSFATETNDSLNWATTLSPNGGTPGIKNSIVNTPKYSSGSLVINEIMFDPAAGNAEYLEFYNTTNDSIQLGGMEIRIGQSAKFKLANSFFKLAPQNYFVLASDSSIYKSFLWLKLDNKTNIAGSTSLGLSNEGALLILKDLRGDTLDSLIYSSSWHNKNILTTKNRSLERLNPLLGSNVRSNWNTSVNAEGGSPGKQNSIYSENISRESKVVISPNPFSPDNDGFEDFAIINFDLAQPLSQVRIKVFDSQGRLVRTLADNRPSASNNSIIFDGLDESGKPLRIGIYILLIEAVAEGSGNVEVIKTPVVVARKL